MLVLSSEQGYLCFTHNKLGTSVARVIRKYEISKGYKIIVKSYAEPLESIDAVL